MPTGYDYQAATKLYIGTTLAFTPGQLVPDSTVTSQGWVVGTDVVAVGGTPPPSPQILTTSNYATLTLIPSLDATGATDRVAIQAALTVARLANAVGGTVVRLVAGATTGAFVVDQTLVIGSATQLECGPGVTLGLGTSVNVPILTSYASGVGGGPCFGAVDVAVTAGSTSIVASGATSAKPAARFNSFTGTQPVVIHDHLGGTFATTGTYVDATHITLAAAPTLSVPSAYVEVGARDHDITINDLKVLRTIAGTANWTYTSVILTRVDGLFGARWRAQTSGGLFAYQLADVNRVRIRDVEFPGTGTARDGLHLNGPADDVVIENAAGTTGDDGVPIIPIIGLNLCLAWGPVTNVTYRNVSINSATAMATIWGADATYHGNPASPASFPWVDNIVYENCRGIIDILNGNIKTPTNAAVPIRVGKVTARNHKGQIVTFPNGEIGTIDQFVVNGLEIPATLGVNLPAVQVAGGTIDKLTLRDVTGSTSNAQNRIVAVNGTSGSAARVNKVTFDGCDYTNTVGATPDFLGILSAYSSVGTMKVRGSRLTGGSGVSGELVYSTAAGTLDRLFVTDTEVDGFLVANLSAAGTEIYFQNVRFTGYGALYVTAAVTVRGSGLNFTGTNTLTTGSHVKSLEFPVDVSTIGKALGDCAYNTNAGLACGVGPVVCTGTGTAPNWKNLLTGATY